MNEEESTVREEERTLAHLTLVARIQARMQLLGLNPFSAAKKAGLGGDYVRDIIRGKVKNPSAERLGMLAEALECSLYYLLGQEEIESRVVERVPPDPEGGRRLPAPLPMWSPADGKPVPVLLPIRFEIMADAYRKATDVVRAPVGFEAATIPPAYIGREAWWEVVRDDSVARVAPAGSLVLVVAMKDDERDQIANGEFVIVNKRFVGPDSAFHLQERSMRRVNYRYPDLGLWFLDYAHLDASRDETDDIWRETDPTEPRKNLLEIAAEIEDPAERAHYEAQISELMSSLEEASRADPKRTARLVDKVNDPEFVRDVVEKQRRWRPILVGKVIRVLTPIDPRAGFGAS